MQTLEATYTTQSQAQTFCDTFNRYVSRGQQATWRRVGAGEYQVWVSLA